MKDLRVHNRVNYRVKLSCSRFYDSKGTIIKFEEPKELEVFDLSLSGLGVITKYEFMLDSTLEFTLYLEDVPYQVMAIIKWEDNNQVYYRYGLEIIGHNNMLFRHLKAFTEGKVLTDIN